MIVLSVFPVFSVFPLVMLEYNLKQVKEYLLFTILCHSFVYWPFWIVSSLNFCMPCLLQWKGSLNSFLCGKKNFAEMSEVRYRRLPQHDEHGISCPLLVPHSLIFPFFWILSGWVQTPLCLLKRNDESIFLLDLIILTFFDHFCLLNAKKHDCIIPYSTIEKELFVDYEDTHPIMMVTKRQMMPTQ